MVVVLRSMFKRLIALLGLLVSAGVYADVLVGQPSAYPAAVNSPPVWTCAPGPFFEEDVASSYELDLCVTETEAEDMTFVWEAGCTQPSGITLDNANDQIDASGSTTSGTTTGCVVSADDGVNDPVNSDPFTVTITPPPAELLAFPSAYGFASEATGGRGGEVVYVTSLANSGAGTLRNALTVGRTATPRNILFAICGRIQLTSNLDVRNNANLGNVTIAGQTAPCPVVITNEDTTIGVPNMIMRYLTFLSDGNNTSEGIVMLGWDPNSRDNILDHISMGWHSDEVFDIVGGDNGLTGKRLCANMYGAGLNCPRNFTLQNSIVAEGIAIAPSEAGEADIGKGVLTYGATNISVIRNLIANNYKRSPIFYDQTTETINNLIYNYSGYGENAMLISGYWDVGCHSIMGNHFKDGPVTHSTSIVSINSNGDLYNSSSHFYVEGNYHRTRRATDGLAETAILSTSNYDGMTLDSSPFCAGMIAKTDPMIMDPFVSSAVHTYVLANAGNQLPAWTEDLFTSRILSEAASGTTALGTQGDNSCTGTGFTGNPNCTGGSIWDTFSDFPGSFPTIETTSYTPSTVDTDLDGITNACEDANGLNKNSAADGDDITASGYSNLDKFLNYKAGDTVPGYNAC